MSTSQKNPKNADTQGESKAVRYEQQILDTSSIGVLITRISDGTILYANKTIAGLLGIKDIDSVIGTPVPDFYWDAEDRKTMLEHLRTEGSITNSDLRARRADGSMAWVSISTRPFTFENEQVFLSEITDISARKQAEEALHQTQALYQSLVEVSPMSICRKDLAGRFTFANQRFLELSQITLADLVGKTDSDLHPSELADKYRSDDLAVMESGRVKEFIEERMVHEGEVTYVETIKTPIYDETGKVNGIQISFWDVTDRMRAEEDLLLRDRALDSSVNAVIIIRLSDNKNIYLNDALLKMTGYTREEAMRLTFADIAADPGEMKKIQAAVNTQGFFTGEELIKRKDGSFFPTSFSNSLIKDGKGRPFAIQSSFFDITERKQAEQAQKESEERFRSLYNNSTVGLYRTTPDGKILMINPTGLRLLGFDSFEELAKRNLEQSGFEEVDARKNFREKLEREGIIELESVWTKKDGTPIFVRESSTVSWDENGKALYYDGSFEDITERKKAETALRESDERFRRFTEATREGLVFHEQGRIIDANPAGLAMFGLSDFKEFVGKNLMEFVVPEFHQLILKQMQLDNVDPYEIQCIRKDRSSFPVETSTRTYKIGDQTVRATSIRDISERKQAEADKLREKNTSDAIINSLPGIFYMFDTQGKLIRRNKNYDTVAGYSAEETTMRKALDAVAEEDRERVAQAIQRAFTEGKVELEMLFLTRHGEKIPYFMSAVRMTMGDDMYVVGTGLDLSERKQAETELRQSELRLTNAISIARMGYWDLDIDTQMFIFNDQYYRTFHATTTEEMGGNQMSVMDFIKRFIPPGEGDIIGNGMQEAIETKDPNFNIKLEAQNLTVQGELRWVSVWLTVEKDEHGRTIKLHGVNQDITERKRAGQALQESQRLLQLVMDNIPQAVFWKNKELAYLGTNRAFAEDAGFNSPQELIGKTDFDMPWKEQAELYRADDQRVLELGETKLNYEEPQTGPTGEVTWLRTSKIPMRDIDGKIFAVLGMYEDITEQKRLQQNVQEGFERRGYQVQISTEISQEVAAASEFNDLFGRVVTLTKERLGYYHTQLLQYDAAQDAVVLINGYGETGKNMLAGGHQMPMGQGLIGTAAANGETVLRPVLTDDPDWHPNPLLPNTKGEIAVPIKWQNTVLGVLDVQSNHAGALGDEDRILLEGLCGQIAIAMHNTELVETIRQNETRLAEALRAARLGNWEYDFENDLFIFTDDFYSIFRTTAEKVGGYKISSADYAKNFVHPDDAQLVGIEIQKVLDSKDRLFTTHLEHRIIFSDGEIGHIAVNINVERDENGKITRWYGANQDITERKQAEEALRINETRLAEALRAARLANWEYDVEKDLFTFNDEFYSIFHTTAEKAGGYQISSARYAEIFVHPDDLEVVGIEIGKALSSTERVYNTTLDHRIRYEDGSIGYIMVKITVERDENGKITRYYGANQDITERKQAEEALRVNENFLTEALQIARLAHWEYDVEKDIFTFNDQFYSIFHTTAEEHGGYQLSSAYYAQHFVYPEDLPVVGVEIEQALNSTGRHYSRDVEHRILYADGGIGYMQVNISVDRDENGKIIRYYGANQDVTERVKQQQEMAERLEEINRLYQNLSHEGWMNYRNTADLPEGFMYDKAGLKPVDQDALADELFANIPMRVLGGEVVGSLAIANDPQHPTSPEDYAFLQQVSSQIALALESARLAAQTQSALAQSEILFESSRRLAQVSDLQDLVKTTIETFNIPVINGAELDMFNYDSEGELESLSVVANWWNGTGTKPGEIGSHFPKAMFSAIKLFLTTTPVSISDALDSERVDASMLRIVKTFNIRAVTFLPLFVGTHQIGVLVMHAEEPHNFTEEETRLFSGLAPQIATVLENRRQYERAQQQAERESTLNVISQKIQGATTVEAVLQIAARELGHALGAPMTIAQLSMKDKK